MMEFSAIRTLHDEEEYQAALKAIRPYFDREPDPGTSEADNFDALFLLIEGYEANEAEDMACRPGMFTQRTANGAPPAQRSK